MEMKINYVSLQALLEMMVNPSAPHDIPFASPDDQTLPFYVCHRRNLRQVAWLILLCIVVKCCEMCKLIRRSCETKQRPLASIVALALGRLAAGALSLGRS
jgi:hypothetical protein